MKKIITLTMFDLKYVFRDFMLVVSILAPIMLSLLFRFALPVISSFVEGRFSVNLSAYSDLFIIILLLVVPVMQGLFAAFIILDEQDEQILSFVSVTPLTKEGYLIYRLGAPILINMVLSIVSLMIAGYSYVIEFSFIPILILLALKAPLVSLLVAGFAKNKVEGLAVSKLASILLLVPFIYVFVEGPLKYLGGVLPPFWTVAAFMNLMNGSTGEFWLYTTVSLATHILFIMILFNRFRKII
ncbi:hypothetical protein ACFYKX_15225 [Cytobacillus sp. FJAT-54145]|uniref:ABC transporter permease n=1 Tax=Cytobacillus spartinae TaxID=3299023 RepID=A0ABW6KCN7_9BACI